MIQALIEGLLGWIDKPWKAILVLVTLPLVVGFYLIYQEQEMIGDYLHTRFGTVKVNVGAVEAEVPRLLHYAEMAVIWQVTLSENYQLVVGAYDRNGSLPDLVGREDSFLTRADTVEAVTDTLSGIVACWDLADPYFGRNLDRVCVVKIPPGAGPIVGMLQVAGYNPADEESLRGVLGRVAQRLTRQ